MIVIFCFVKDELSRCEVLHQHQSHCLHRCVSYIGVAEDPERLIMMVVIILLKTSIHCHLYAFATRHCRQRPVFSGCPYATIVCSSIHLSVHPDGSCYHDVSWMA